MTNIPEEQRSIAGELVAWMAADLVTHIRNGDWVAAMVNISYQQEKLAGLLEVVMGLSKHEGEPTEDFSIGQMLDALIVKEKEFHAGIDADFGDKIRKMQL